MVIPLLANQDLTGAWNWPFFKNSYTILDHLHSTYTEFSKI